MQRSILKFRRLGCYVGFGAFGSRGAVHAPSLNVIESLKTRLKTQADPISRGHTLHSLGAAYLADGVLDEAHTYLQEGVEQYRLASFDGEAARSNELGLASVLCGKAACLYIKGLQEGQLSEEVLALANEAFGLRKKWLSPSDVSLAECLNTIGSFNYARGSYVPALEAFQEEMQILLEASNGVEENSYVIMCYYNLGLCYLALGRSEGEASIRKAIVLGESHWTGESESDKPSAAGCRKLVEMKAFLSNYVEAKSKKRPQSGEGQ